MGSLQVLRTVRHSALSRNPVRTHCKSVSVHVAGRGQWQVYITSSRYQSDTGAGKQKCLCLDSSFSWCRVLAEVSEREEVENTKLQMQKRRRQGNTKMRKGKGGQDVEIARLDAKVHRRDSRTARKVQVKDILEEELC